ncbi:MAG: efflux RND transporter periplasmic adaptor subunit [Desulfopila sp.]|jgi:HlyD family secretion protein|nr:efflux RND transporter periplasmic adaptor subunit [Desulfopila sp.]
MRRLIRWGVFFVIVITGAYFIWEKTRPQPVEITVKPVLRGTVEETVANTRAGTVEACRRAKLSPSIGGQIASLPIKEGDFIKAGTLLLEIWNEDLKAQLVLAERETEVARAQAESACLTAEEANRQAQRTKRLFQSNVATEEQTDRAVTQAKSLQAQCNAAQANARMSLARIDVARANLSRTRLIAPFDGVVAKIEGELNEYVTPSPVGVQTPPAVDLIENNCFYVSAPIDEMDAAAIRPGMQARITLDAYKDRHFSGTVRRIAPFVLDLEKQARTVDIEAAFAGEEIIQNLLAGYSADIEIILATSPETLYIPTEALVDGDTVFVFNKEQQTVRQTIVTRGLSNWSLTEVVGGLKENQLVVTNIDKPGLKDGVKAILSESSP